MHPHKEALPFKVNKKRGVTEEQHTAYSCTIVMHTREAGSGAGERMRMRLEDAWRDRGTDGQMDGFLDLICPLPDSASTNSESGSYCSLWHGCKGARYSRTDSLRE